MGWMVAWMKPQPPNELEECNIAKAPVSSPGNPNRESSEAIDTMPNLPHVSHNIAAVFEQLSEQRERIPIKVANKNMLHLDDNVTAQCLVCATHAFEFSIFCRQKRKHLKKTKCALTPFTSDPF